MLPRLACFGLPLIALFVIALPATAAPSTLREVPWLLSLLALGLIGSNRLALLGCAVFGLACDILLHLPLGAFSLPAVSLVLSLSLLRTPLLRQPLWQALPSIGFLLLAYEWLLGQWLIQLGGPALPPGWMAPLLATLLWTPLALLAQHAEETF